jgi:hypothetical protein
VANVKLSAIVASGSNLAATDQAVIVRSGTTDLLASFAQMQAGLGINPLVVLTGPASTAKTFTLPNSSQSLACLDLADQTVSGGANVTAQSLTAGNITVDCGSRPLQFITNNGAFTITAPANDGSCIILVTNGASAGAITFSGFTVGSSTGDAYVTTNAQKFSLHVWRINGVSGYRWAAHQ